MTMKSFAKNSYHERLPELREFPGEKNHGEEEG
jgi:hypothetical protein